MAICLILDGQQYVFLECSSERSFDFKNTNFLWGKLCSFYALFSECWYGCENSAWSSMYFKFDGGYLIRLICSRLLLYSIFQKLLLALPELIPIFLDHRKYQYRQYKNAVTWYGHVLNFVRAKMRFFSKPFRSVNAFQKQMFFCGKLWENMCSLCAVFCGRWYGSEMCA